MPKRVLPQPDFVEGALPFSKAVEANGFVFLAGQTGDAPGSAGPVPGGIEAETRAVCENIGRLLRAAGLDFPDVVQATIYLCDFADLIGMNSVYRQYFRTDPPARATVGVTRLVENYRVEIAVVAAR